VVIGGTTAHPTAARAGGRPAARPRACPARSALVRPWSEAGLRPWGDGPWPGVAVPSSRVRRVAPRVVPVRAAPPAGPGIRARRGGGRRRDGPVVGRGRPRSRPAPRRSLRRVGLPPERATVGALARGTRAGRRRPALRRARAAPVRRLTARVRPGHWAPSRSMAIALGLVSRYAHRPSLRASGRRWDRSGAGRG
jgi:hypothetical protein